MIGFVVVWFIPAKGEPATEPSRVELSKRESEISSLKDQIAGLEKRNRELAKENEKLQARISELKARGNIIEAPLRVNPPAVTPRNSLSVPDNMPRGSVPHEFNGSTFYVVPLGHGQVQNSTLAPASNAK
jgi:hypothetical protein